MRVLYVVRNYDMCAGTPRALSTEFFDSVEDAIEFHSKQKDTEFSWWDIFVDYYDEAELAKQQ